MTHRRLFISALLALIWLALIQPVQAIAQPLPFNDGALPSQASNLQAPKLTWTIHPDPDVARSGEWIALRFDLSIEEGWKLYALDSPAGRPLAIEFDSLPPGVTLEGIRQQRPETGYDPNFDEDVRYFKDSATVQAGISLSDEITEGHQTLHGQITYMVCNDDICLPPRTEPFEVDLSFEQGPARAAFAEARWPEVEQPGEQHTAARIQTAEAGITGFLLLAIGAALATLLTPCVLPMVPLTVSYFSSRATDRSGAIRTALVFGASIVVLFTGLGAATSALLGAAGAAQIATNPWVNLLLGIIFVVFALSLLGAFELRVPSKLLNYLNQRGERQSGLLGVALMALTTVLVSFSCTAPFVGGLLAASAQGSWLRPLVGMLIFSSVLALPFVLLALFPGAMSRLPRSGPWMNTMKGVLGFVELAAALKFLSNADLVMGWGILPRPAAIALLMAIAVVAGLFILGKLSPGHETSEVSVGAGRLIGAVLSFGFVLYLLPGLLGSPLGWLDAYLPPRTSGAIAALPSQTEAAGAELPWYTDDIDAAFTEAREKNVPVFVDFTGYTCTNCREMEATVFPKPEVAGQLRNDFVLLRLYTDGRKHGQTFQEYQLNLTGTIALPTYAVVAPEGTMISAHSGMASVAEFASFLEAGLTQYAAGDSTQDAPPLTAALR